MEPDVSIIIPVYNADKYLSASMQNVLNQTYHNIEVILIDDGSTDSSGQICDEYAKQDQRIKVLHQENSGVSTARNNGIRNATGKYIMFLDVDDGIDNDLLEDNLSLLLQYDADLLIYCFRYYYPDKEIFSDNILQDSFWGSGEEFFRNRLIEIIDHELLHAPWNKLISRKLLIDNSILFDTRYSIYEDITFSVKLCNAARKIYVNPKAYYTYNIWTQGTLRTKFWDNNFDAASELYRNAIMYCDSFDDNEPQVARFNLLYSGIIINYIKRVCLNKEISAGTKNKILNQICSSEVYRGALKKTVFAGGIVNVVKKNIVRSLILHHRIGLIKFSYAGLSCLKDRRGE